MKQFSYIFLLVFLTACSSLEQNSSQLDIGSSKKDILQAMGPPPYQYTYEDIFAWRYSDIATIGVCQYVEIYIYRDKIIQIDGYNNGSYNGCEIGMRDIDWEPILAKAKEYDRLHPLEKSKAPEAEGKSLVLELQELKQLRDSGALSEVEYTKAKESIINSH